MAGTYSQILLHIVFSTKNRKRWITSELSERLYPYIGGIIRAEKGHLLQINGFEDHVHLLVRWRPDGLISDLMRIVKSRSSRWIHESMQGFSSFRWQEGYSVFSVSKSQEDSVRGYIARQREHHVAQDYRAEILQLLKWHEVAIDMRYVFD